MDTTAATHLASQINSLRQDLCLPVATKLLRTFPELTHALRIEENYHPTARLSEMAVERLSDLVRAVLLFESPALADTELRWASGVLPRSGVTYEHQSAMVRWYFEEVRRLPLSPGEVALTNELEYYFLEQVRLAYKR